MRIPFRPSPDDGEVFLRDPLLLHEKPKTARGGRVLRYEDQAAGLAIEPINDRNLTAVRNLKSQELF